MNYSIYRERTSMKTLKFNNIALSAGLFFAVLTGTMSEASVLRSVANIALGVAMIDNAPNYLRSSESKEEDGQVIRTTKTNDTCFWDSMGEAVPAVGSALVVNRLAKRLLPRPLATLCYVGMAAHMVVQSSQGTQKLNKKYGYKNPTITEIIFSESSKLKANVVQTGAFKYVDEHYLASVKSTCRPLLESTKALLGDPDLAAQHKTFREHLDSATKFASKKICAGIDYCLALMEESTTENKDDVQFDITPSATKPVEKNDDGAKN